MTPSEFTRRVTVETCVVVVVLTLAATWLAGASAGLGILGGGVLAVANFRWLVARVLAVSSGYRGGAWLVGVGARFAVLLIAGAVLLAKGQVHPVALLFGFTVLPCAVIAQGLHAARRAD